MPPPLGKTRVNGNLSTNVRLAVGLDIVSEIALDHFIHICPNQSFAWYDIWEVMPFAFLNPLVNMVNVTRLV